MVKDLERDPHTGVDRTQEALTKDSTFQAEERERIGRVHLSGEEGDGPGMFDGFSTVQQYDQRSLSAPECGKSSRENGVSKSPAKTAKAEILTDIRREERRSSYPIVMCGQSTSNALCVFVTERERTR